MQAERDPRAARLKRARERAGATLRKEALRRLASEATLMDPDVALGLLALLRLQASLLTRAACGHTPEGEQPRGGAASFPPPAGPAGMSGRWRM